MADNTLKTPSPAVDKYGVGTIIEQMGELHRHRMMLAYMQYPKTSKLDANDHSICICTYSCDDLRCDFAPCKRAIAENVDLRTYGSQKVLDEIAQDIDSYQVDHMAAQLDGFQIWRSGYDLLRMQRVRQEVPVRNGRTGFIEYNDLQNEGLRWYEEQKLKTLNQTLKSAVPAPASAPKYCALF